MFGAGDRFIAPFTKGSKGNLVSRSPDDKIVLIADDQEYRLTERVPYIVTVKKPLQRDGQINGYIVKLEDAAKPRDYDVVKDLDRASGEFTLTSSLPSRFEWARTIKIPAIVDKRVEDDELVITYQAGPHRRVSRLTKARALQLGYSFAHFLPPVKPEGVLAPRPIVEGHTTRWTPGIRDVIGFLFDDTSSLIGTMPLEEVQGLAERRVQEAYWTQIYTRPQLVHQEAAHTDHRITGWARRIAQASGALTELANAEAAVLKSALKHLPDRHLLRLAHHLHGFTEHSGLYGLPLRQYLELTQGLGAGRWHLANQDLRNGYVCFTSHALIQLLAEHHRQDVLATDHGEAPALALPELMKPEREEHAAAERLPPCMRFLARKATHQSLTKVEERLLGNHLFAAGFSSRGIRELTGQSAELRPLPSCEAVKAMGLCAWSCAPTSPHQNYLEAA